MAGKTGALVALLAAMAAGGCGPSDGGGDGEQTATASAAPAAEESTLASRLDLADRQAERAAMEEVDAAFPHSAHRDLSCRRCHRRPPGHETHMEAECTACHGRPAGFATLPRRSGAECAGCHHTGERADQCRSCHEADAVGGRPVLVSVQPSGADGPRVRRLTFDHADHAGRACTTCHTDPPLLSFDRGCDACHEAHHHQEAECMTCHVVVGPPTHTEAVHGGCTGGGCHEVRPVFELEPTRNVCLACHQDLVQHKPGQRCTECHAGSWSPVPASQESP